VAVLKAIKAGRIKAVGEGRDKKIDSDQADRDWTTHTDPARQSVLHSAGPAAPPPLLDDEAADDTADDTPDDTPDDPLDDATGTATGHDSDTQTYRTERARRETIRRQREQLALEQERKRLVDKAEVERPSSTNTETRPCIMNQRRKSKSFHVSGVSIGSAKYRQHFAVQYAQSTSPGFRSERFTFGAAIRQILAIWFFLDRSATGWQCSDAKVRKEDSDQCSSSFASCDPLRSLRLCVVNRPPGTRLDSSGWKTPWVPTLRRPTGLKMPPARIVPPARIGSRCGRARLLDPAPGTPLSWNNRKVSRRDPDHLSAATVRFPHGRRQTPFPNRV
jgi:hypothetical protein